MEITEIVWMSESLEFYGSFLCRILEHLKYFFFYSCPHAGYYKKPGSKSNTPEDRSEIPTVVIRNKNLNRGVLKPKEPVKANLPPNKIEKVDYRDNIARTKKTVDNIDSQKPVPGGINYVPSKESKVKKDIGNKPKQVEVVVENKELAIDNSLTDIGEWGVLCCPIIV